MKEYHQVLSLECRIGPIFDWCDNYDVVVSTPNGHRVTYAMAVAFAQHPASIIYTLTVAVLFLRV